MGGLEDFILVEGGAIDFRWVQPRNLCGRDLRLNVILHDKEATKLETADLIAVKGNVITDTMMHTVLDAAYPFHLGFHVCLRVRILLLQFFSLGFISPKSSLTST